MTLNLTDIRYPPIKPYNSGFIDVSGGHSIYWEECGNPQGMSVVFLHGGPGSGCASWQRQFFNPDKYHIILFDQRGAGKSTPHASLEHNTTQHLIEDMEQLRETLSINRWHISGGSWGSTLALAYTDMHPSVVQGLVLFGIFLARDHELYDMYYDGGVVSRLFPDIFDDYLSLLPDHDKQNPIKGYQRLFTHDDPAVRKNAVSIWTRLEKKIAKLVVSEEELNAEMADPDYVLAHSLLENHYFLNNGFINGDALLQCLSEKLKNTPLHIIQGRYDVVCPMKSAWDLHKAVPHSQLHIVPDAGHAGREAGISAKMIEILDQL